MTTPSSDAHLIRGFLDGDEQAFRALYERHSPRLKMTLLRLLGSRKEDVEDVLQDTWLAGCRGMHTYRGDAKFSTWLTSIGVRVALALLRRPAHREVDLEIDYAVVDDRRAEIRVDVELALARLPDHQRVVMVLHDLEGLTHEDIGELLGIAAGTSKATLSYARAALRAEFALGREA